MERAFTSQQCVLMISAQRGFSPGNPVFSAPQKLSKFLIRSRAGETCRATHWTPTTPNALFARTKRNWTQCQPTVCQSRGRGRGGGGTPVLRISSDGDDRMGEKNQNPKKSIGLPTKVQKIPGPKVNPQRIPCRILEP